MIANVDDYFLEGCGRCERFATPECSVHRWGQGLGELRQLCLAAGLSETVKWSQPCYVFNHRNVVILGAFRHDFRLTFFDGGLLDDPENRLQKRGPNSRHADMLKFTDNAQVAPLRKVIAGFLKAAKGHAKAGTKLTGAKETLVLPEELIEAMAIDDALAVAFEKLTPGRKRSYVLNLSSATKSQTRRDRIARFRPKIMAGKGATER